ncbi:MAG TPA: AAA family ATPase [Acidimicrobiales bacterium]
MTVHPDLEAERAYLTRAYEHLAAMRARARQAAAIAESAAQAVDSAIARAHLEHRVRSLDDDVPGLAFGRLDDEDGARWYVGRRHVEDERGEPVVVDWRAPVSTPFYRATAADPLGLRRRRRFLMTGRQLDDLFDEVFDDPDSVDAAHHGGIPDPLLAELERSRTGEMRDIVATIAAEQDVVIRAPLDTCLVVQGGPGTGKTAVGLHRAAFLLFDHREALDREGVLVVGPNPLFLRYIAQVLPSLGETAARQTTVERLVGGRVRAFDTPEAARIKGDARMATVLARAARQHLRPPADDVEVATPWGAVRLPAAAVREVVDEVAGRVERGVPFATGRSAFRTRLRRLARLAHEAARGDGAAPADQFEAAWAGNAEASALAGRIWPSLSAPALVKRVLTNRRALARAAEGVLEPVEQAAILRKGGRRIDDEPWTVAELVLVDEAEALLNGVRRTYGHVVVDEAQDLSAMELRAVARRCPSRSMTVLGDLAQATAPGAQAAWGDVVRLLGSPDTARVEELELGYRVPAPIIEVANRLLPAVAPGVRPARSVRPDGRAPVVVGVGEGGDLAGEVAARAVAAAAAWTSVGVVVPEPLVGAVGDALAAVGAGFGSSRRPGRSDAITLLAPPEAKGLEFDAVVVGEPAGFLAGGSSGGPSGDPADALAADPAGGRLLYIALTRAVQELTIVHAAPLPPPLT